MKKAILLAKDRILDDIEALICKLTCDKNFSDLKYKQREEFIVKLDSLVLLFSTSDNDPRLPQILAKTKYWCPDDLE